MLYLGFPHSISLSWLSPFYSLAVTLISLKGYKQTTESTSACRPIKTSSKVSAGTLTAAK